MSIDFFTLVAQIFNLILLLFLLRKFLYLPVLKVVEDRQKLIKSELQKAASEHQKALSLSKKCSDKLADIDRQKQEILDLAQVEAQALAQKLGAEVRQEYENAQKQWKNRLLSEQKTLELALQNLIVERFDAFAQGALTQIADISLNALIVEKFKQKIVELTPEEQIKFSQALKIGKKIKVISAQSLDQTQQRDLADFILNQLNIEPATKIVFENDSSLICGIALRARDQMISWNLSAYMESFRAEMNDQLETLLKRGKND